MGTCLLLMKLGFHIEIKEEGEFFLRLDGLQKLVIALILRRNLAC